MPELLLQETSPYSTRRASLLRGDGDLYLYLEDLVGPAPATTSAVWVANYLPGPHRRRPGRRRAGAPPRMGAGGTRFPEGCPDLGRPMDLVWFEEGDAVAVVDAEGVLAAIPGWAGRSEFYGYSRYARGRTGLAWELTRDAGQALEAKVARVAGVLDTGAAPAPGARSAPRAWPTSRPAPGRRRRPGRSATPASRS